MSRFKTFVATNDVHFSKQTSNFPELTFNESLTDRSDFPIVPSLAVTSAMAIDQPACENSLSYFKPCKRTVKRDNNRTSKNNQCEPLLGYVHEWDAL